MVAWAVSTATAKIARKTFALNVRVNRAQIDAFLMAGCRDVDMPERETCQLACMELQLRAALDVSHMACVTPTCAAAVNGVTAEVVAVSCDTGYSGGGNWLCKPSGIFAGTVCTANECSPTEVSDSDKSHVGSVVGATRDVITVTCNAGFSGGGEWICEAGGSFIGMSCAGDACTAVTVPNSVDYFEATINGGTNDVVQVECSAGYSGGGSWTCGSDGVFTGVECAADACTATQVAYSDVDTFEAVSGNTGDIQLVTCNEGYSGGGGWECGSDGEFSGTPCSEIEKVDVDDCESSPCINNGVCSDVSGSDADLAYASYACACAPGYSGENCATDIDECASSPCANDGGCSEGTDLYLCICLSGFSGRQLWDRR